MYIDEIINFFKTNKSSIRRVIESVIAASIVFFLLGSNHKLGGKDVYECYAVPHIVAYYRLTDGEVFEKFEIEFRLAGNCVSQI